MQYLASDRKKIESVLGFPLVKVKKNLKENIAI